MYVYIYVCINIHTCMYVLIRSNIHTFIYIDCIHKGLLAFLEGKSGFWEGTSWKIENEMKICIFLFVCYSVLQ